MTKHVAVKFWSEMPEPRGGPDDYPAHVREIGEDVTYEEPADTPWFVMTQEDYEIYVASKATDYVVWRSVQPSNPLPMATARISQAREYGLAIMVEYGARNWLRGYTPSQVKTALTRLASIQNLLVSGSLTTALTEVEVIAPDDLVLQEDKDYFLQRLRMFLGIS